MEYCAGGNGGGRMMIEAEAFERANVELPLDKRDGEVVGQDPVFDAGAGLNPVKLRG